MRDMLREATERMLGAWQNYAGATDANEDAAYAHLNRAVNRLACVLADTAPPALPVQPPKELLRHLDTAFEILTTEGEDDTLRPRRTGELSGEDIADAAEALALARRLLADSPTGVASLQPSPEAGWVIVKNGGPTEAEALKYFTANSPVWGGNAEALRFARKEDAERLMRFTRQNGGFPFFGNARVEEHAWG